MQHFLVNRPTEKLGHRLGREHTFRDVQMNAQVLHVVRAECVQLGGRVQVPSL